MFDFIVGSIAKFKDQGVTEYGKVGHLELAQIMTQTSVWAYPCGHLGVTETFCITAVKAQLAGMIPVTTRIGALNETVHPEAPSIPRIETRADIIAFGILLLRTLDRIRTSQPDLLRNERLKYIAYGRQFSWKACVHKWLELYDQVIL
jgi:glycosyltransferase involved in cell wall biosynthesis